MQAEWQILIYTDLLNKSLINSVLTCKTAAARAEYLAAVICRHRIVQKLSYIRRSQQIRRKQHIVLLDCYSLCGFALQQAITDDPELYCCSDLKTLLQVIGAVPDTAMLAELLANQANPKGIWERRCCVAKTLSSEKEM